MTAGQDTRRMSNVSLAPAPLAGLLAAALVGGAMLGAGITLQLGSSASNAALAGAVAQPGGTLDGAGFRREERSRTGAAAQPGGTLDGAGFRREERGDLVAKPDSGAATSEHVERRGGK